MSLIGFVDQSCLRLREDLKGFGVLRQAVGKGRLWKTLEAFGRLLKSFGGLWEL